MKKKNLTWICWLFTFFVNEVEFKIFLVTEAAISDEGKLVTFWAENDSDCASIMVMAATEIKLRKSYFAKINNLETDT